MKYSQMFDHFIESQYESWMDALDRQLFAGEMALRFGDEFDASIDAGIAKGISIEQQEKALKGFLESLQ